MRRTRRVRGKKKRTQRRGGKRLGQGAYGFVVDPAIACPGKDTSGYVSKVFEPKEDRGTTATRMMDKVKTNPVFTKLKEIDPNQTMFLYPELCDTPGELSAENRADGVTDENKKYSYLIRRGGHSLETEMKEKTLPGFADAATILKEGIHKMPSAYRLYTKEVLSYLEPKIQTQVNYLKPIVAEMFKLRDILYENGISQGDLHPGNVLRMSDGTLRIIDFDDAVLFDPKNPPHTHFEDFKAEDGGVFIEMSAALLAGRKMSNDTDEDILHSKITQRIVDLVLTDLE